MSGLPLNSRPVEITQAGDGGALLWRATLQRQHMDNLRSNASVQRHVEEQAELTAWQNTNTGSAILVSHGKGAKDILSIDGVRLAIIYTGAQIRLAGIK
jgi:hypothetical protein